MTNRPDGKTRPQTAQESEDPPDPIRLGQDWLTLWHSEIAAMLADREQWEHWRLLSGLWSAAAMAMLPAAAAAEPQDVPVSGTRPHRSAGPAAPARPAPAAATPDAGGATADDVQHLRDRVGELEQRLATMERAKPRRRAIPR